MAITKDLTTSQKQEILAQALETSEGRVAFAQGMVEPIRRSLEYQAIGRKLLMSDELPQGAYARYERDVASVAYRVSRRGGVPEQITEGEEVLVPTFEIAVFPTIRLSEINARRFYIVDRAQIKAKEAIQKEEDTSIFGAAIAAAVGNNKVINTLTNLTVGNINDAFRSIEEHDLVAAKVVMNARQYATVRNFGVSMAGQFFDQATQREVISTGLFGHIFTADIHVSSRMPYNKVLVTAPADTVGVFPIRTDITVLPADDPRKLRVGWVIYEEVGVCILNDYACAVIEVTYAT
jgi:hypothetical protein